MKWEDAADLILPDVRDCPWPMAKSRLILAARDFCSRTSAWRIELDPFKSIAGVAEYPELIESRQMEVVRVLRAYFGEKKLVPVNPGAFFALRVERQRVGPPEFMTVRGDAILLHPAPSESGVEILVEATFKPSLTSTTFPTELWNQYGETIADGAKARLYKSPGKPYTDLNMAAVAAGDFNAACGKARARIDRGMSTPRQRVRGYYH